MGAERRVDMGSLGLPLPLLLLLWQWTLISAGGSHWTYEGSMGQSRWPEDYPDCGGSAQSPIDVVTSESRYDPKLRAVTPLGYSQHGSEPFHLTNNGHTVVVPLPEWMGVGGLPSLYSAVQMHLHWGSGAPGAGGSEHTINKHRSDAELHVVHYNSELYPNMSMAMTQRAGLAVLGVLIEVGDETNQGYGNILNYLTRVRHAGQSVPIPAFDVLSLLPANLERYYRYNGSLTTPPCYESVLWTVFTEKVTISRAQMMKLATALNTGEAGDAHATTLQENYRATLPLNQRTVLRSFPTESGKVYSAAEVTAIVIGVLCGCVGLIVIIRFIVKTIRSTSSWDVLPSIRPTPMSRSLKEPEKEPKQDVALGTTTAPAKDETPPCNSSPSPTPNSSTSPQTLP